MSLMSILRRPNPVQSRKARTTRQSFALEGLEDRLVMSHAAVVPAAMPAAHVAPAAAAHNTVSVPINITGLNLTGVTKNAQGLITGLTGTVSGTIDGIAFSKAPLTIATGAGSSAAVPVLDLHLGPINLNLLGLQVKTSEICLNITAKPGPGNLLGNLVGGLSNALNGTLGGGAGGLLGGLNGVIGGITGTTGTATTTAGALGTLNSLLSSGSSSVLGLLNSGVSSALGSMKAAAPAAATPTVDNLVHLTVGPLNLDLLGLDVKLDNCAGGPITVDVNAISGSGNLLGNLLTGVAHLLDNSGHGAGLLTQVDNELLGLIKGL